MAYFSSLPSRATWMLCHCSDSECHTCVALFSRNELSSLPPSLRPSSLCIFVPSAAPASGPSISAAWGHYKSCLNSGEVENVGGWLWLGLASPEELQGRTPDSGMRFSKNFIVAKEYNSRARS